MSEEEIELIERDGIDNPYYSYCYCTKDIIAMSECKCKWVVCVGVCLPIVIVVDTIMFIPQLISNNLKLCFQ